MLLSLDIMFTLGPQPTTLSTGGLFSFWPLSLSQGPTRDPWDPWGVQGLAPSRRPRATGCPGAASAGQTFLLASSQSCLGSRQQFPKSRQELQLKLHQDRAWRKEKVDMSGKKELCGNSAAGNQTFRMGADFLEAWKGTGSPTSVGNGKCEHSKRRVRRVLICLVGSTSHTRWMLSRTTNYNFFWLTAWGWQWP